MTVTVQTPPPGDQPGQWLSIKLAADNLSVSERTVSRWVSRGKLRRRYREDGHVEVWVPTVEADNEDDNGPDTSPDIDGQERSLQLLERVDAVLTRQQQPLLERIGALAERVEVVARENGQLTERTLALTHEVDTVKTASARAVRSWRVAAALLAALVAILLVLGMPVLARST